MIAETHTDKGLEKEMEKFAIFRALEIATERGLIQVQFAYCTRRKNQIAHRLARKGAQI